MVNNIFCKFRDEWIICDIIYITIAIGLSGSISDELAADSMLRTLALGKSFLFLIRRPTCLKASTHLVL
jgi:hypothetical protein